MFKTLFSLRGRVSRGAFWGVGFGWMAAFLVIGGLIAAIGVAGDDLNPVGYGLAFAMFFLFWASMWSGFTLGVRRYHDLGKSGWWTLIAGVPVVGLPWYIVEAGFFRGEAGANQYGPDPLNRIAPAAAFA